MVSKHGDETLETLAVVDKNESRQDLPSPPPYLPPSPMESTVQEAVDRYLLSLNPSAVAALFQNQPPPSYKPASMVQNLSTPMGPSVAAAQVDQLAANPSTLAPIMRSVTAVHPSDIAVSSSQAPSLGFRGLSGVAVVQPTTGSFNPLQDLAFHEVSGANSSPNVTGSQFFPPTVVAIARAPHQVVGNQHDQHGSVGLSLAMIQ